MINLVFLARWCRWEPVARCRSRLGIRRKSRSNPLATAFIMLKAQPQSAWARVL